MAIFLYFIFGAALFYFSIFFPYTGLFFSVFLLLLIFVRRYNNAALKLSHIALAGILCAGGYLYAKLLYLPQTNSIELQGSSIELKGLLKSERLSSSNRGTFFIQNIDVIEAFDSKGDRLFIKELRAVNESSLDTEKIYHIRGRFSRDGYYLNPGSSSSLPGFYVLSATETGEYNSNFFEKMRAELNGFMRESFSDKSSAFLLSIITGERIFLTAETRNAFSVTGLAHILSISGAHFGLLFVMVFTSFRMLFKYLPNKFLTRLTIYFTPSQIAAVMTAPFLVFYLGISSVSIPSIRAFIMITFFLVGLLFGRKGLWLNTLVIAAFIIVLISPGALTDLSFQLSFSAVLCIGLITERLRNKDMQNDVPEEQRKDGFLSNPAAFIFKYLKYSFLISIAATAGTAPLVAYYFHYFSLISPFTNLLLTPLIGFIILPAALLSSLAYLVSGVFPFILMLDSLTMFILELIEKIAQWPFIDIKIPAFPPVLLLTFYTGLLLFAAIEYLRLQGIRRGIVSLYAASLSLLILPFLIYAAVKYSEPAGLKITFLDVGQGDAAVVELSDNRILVIDTGRSGYQVAAYLRYKGIRNIDALAISHRQIDHAGGIEYLLGNFNISEIWGGGIEPYINLPEQSYYRRLQRGDVVEGSGYKIFIFHPYDGFYTGSAKDDENNYSLVMKITGYKNSFLFTGDIEREALEDLSNLRSYLKSNALKVPHHGSRSSADEMFYGLVSPEIAVISVGRKNFHGHPHEDALRILRTAAVLRTDIDGAVGLQEMPDGRINVKTFREFRFRQALNWLDEVYNIKRLFSVW
jgi:competence protein ComEC